MLSLLNLVLLSSPNALACGGFFCQTVPVDQSAERIVFAQGEGEVEVHVQIFYTGAAPEFAWVVPTPTQPELFLSSDLLFTELSLRYAPRFSLDFHESGTCLPDPRSTLDTGTLYSSWGDSGYYGYTTDETGVTVVAEAAVGPYETVTLQANTSAALLDWLQDNGFDLPDDLDPALAPYVASGSYFVALKLAKDQDAGDIAPLGMRYPGSAVSVPIQLTSIAATPDMRLEVYLLGEGRGVPDNYLHVRINEAAIDWLDGGSNYELAVTRAADEAGGQAFATDYAGPTNRMRGVLYSDRWDTSRLATLDDPIAFMAEVIRQGLPSGDALLEALRDTMPPPRGVDAQSFYNCVSCYAHRLDDYTFDPAAAAAAIEERVVAPLRHADELFQSHPQLSRLTSSISPLEMTVDPVFVYNLDMGEVPLEHEADLTYLCGAGLTHDQSNRRLVLADGRELLIPSQDWLDDYGLTYGELIEQGTTHYALVIEDTSASGEPVVVVDATEDAQSDVDDLNDLVRWNSPEPAVEAQTCGCRSTPHPLSGLGALLGLLALRRRR
jgi:hypothetical protein